MNAALSNEVRHIADRNPAITVRTRRDQERCILHGDIVQMHSQGQHTCKQIERRSDMLHSCLHGPGTISIDGDTPLDADRAVLMPIQRPIRVGRLIEKNSPDRAAGIAKHLGSDGSYLSVPSQISTEPINAA